MDEYEEYDQDDSVNGDDDDEQIIDLDDEDFDENEYENQDRDVDENAKVKAQDNNEDETETQFDISGDFDFEASLAFAGQHKRKTSSNITRITKYEYAKAVGTLATYISESRIDVPDEMLETPAVKSGNAIKIAFFWFDNRKQYPLPITLKRHLNNLVCEELDPTKLYTDHDLSFRDDNDNTDLLFSRNFRDRDYENDI